MPADKPAPPTPEGKRAAERIRTIFFSIAASNLVIAAIVMWQRSHAEQSREAEPKPAPVVK